MRDIWGKKKERVRVNFLEARTAVHHPVQNTSTWFPPGRVPLWYSVWAILVLKKSYILFIIKFKTYFPHVCTTNLRAGIIDADLFLCMCSNDCHSTVCVMQSFGIPLSNSIWRRQRRAHIVAAQPATAYVRPPQYTSTALLRVFSPHWPSYFHEHSLGIAILDQTPPKPRSGTLAFPSSVAT